MKEGRERRPPVGGYVVVVQGPSNGRPSAILAVLNVLLTIRWRRERGGGVDLLC